MKVALLKLVVIVVAGRYAYGVAFPSKPTAAAAPAPPAVAAPAPPPAAAPAGAGVTYSYEQLTGALAATGMSVPSAKVGAAIAKAESGGRSRAICHNCAGVAEYSVGPWQINLNAHPKVSPACAMELNCAARAANAISGGGRSWSAWTTFKTGAYRRYLA